MLFFQLTAIKTFANPTSIFTNEFPRGLLAHDGSNTSERDLCSMRIPFYAQSAINLGPVPIYESALDPLEKFHMIIIKIMIIMTNVAINQ